jgi:hypothetical protein
MSSVKKKYSCTCLPAKAGSWLKKRTLNIENRIKKLEKRLENIK